ncbi:MAG TPA: MATE family efflux transporter [Fimbriimonas sp.]
MAAVVDPQTPSDVEHENATRVVWQLAWPAVALNSLQVVNTLLDRFFIGHLSQAALTAHGGSLNLMFLMFSLGVAIATGATALVSRAFGANQPHEFREASRQSLSLTIAFSVVLSLATALGARAFSGFILPREDVAAAAEMTSFLLVYATGMPAIYGIQTLAGALRGVGDTKSPMVISGMQILLHILLNYVLIFPSHRIGSFIVPGADLGLIGAALAISISAWIAVFAYMAHLPKTPLGSLWRIAVPHLSWAWRILRIAFPAAIQAALRVFSLMAFTLILASAPQGSAAIAAMSVGFAIEGIMFMPSFGLSAAAGALVGQSLGMGRPDRAERLAWISGHHAALVTLALAGPIYLLAPQIATTLVENKPAISDQATVLLRYLCLTEVMFAYAMVMLGAMQGAGDTKRPLWITVFSLWGMRVPLAFFLTFAAGDVVGYGWAIPVGVGLGTTGAWISMSITQAVTGFLSIVAFRDGKWKTMEV